MVLIDFDTDLTDHPTFFQNKIENWEFPRKFPITSGISPEVSGNFPQCVFGNL